MTGELGVLFQNDIQVGGLYNWAIDLITQPSGTDKEWREYTVSKRITAGQYWLTKHVDGIRFEARFMKYNKEDFLTMDRGQVEINIPTTTPIDKTLPGPLDIRWIG